MACLPTHATAARKPDGSITFEDGEHFGPSRDADGTTFHPLVLREVAERECAERDALIQRLAHERSRLRRELDAVQKANA